MNPLEAAAEAGRRLILFGGVVERSPLVQALLALLEGLAGGPAGDPQRNGPVWERAAHLTRQAWAYGLGDGPAGPSRGADAAQEGPPLWFGAVVEGLLADENPLSRAVSGKAAGREPLGELPPPLLAAAAHDLRMLQRLAHFRPEVLEAAVRRWEPAWPPGTLAGLRGTARPGTAGPWPDGAARVAQRLVGLEDWAQALPDLVGYWRVVGCGLWGQFVAFRWEGEGRGLQPVRALDPTRLEDLVGYETARQAVVENTERLVAGRPAHHLLLYGPRGTGKSATVRALVHTFGPRGLRLVELPLDRVGELPQLLNQLRDQPHPIVILLDDLALEPDDPAARQLKVALEGALELWPEHVRLYATSNRRHVVRERRGASLHQEDEIHEQISLADRFGMTVFFEAADQALYLRIVEGLARQAGVRIVEGQPDGVRPRSSGQPGGAAGPAPDGEAGRLQPPWVVDRQTLEREALQWALWQNERSPRTAAQFVRDWLGRWSEPT